MQITVKTDGIIWLNPCEYFKPTAQLISNNPAINKYIQCISLSPFSFVIR